METDLPPGSKGAVARGCTCNPVVNRFGKGYDTMSDGSPVYRPDNNCPMHGLALAIEELKEAGAELPDERPTPKRRPRRRKPH